MAWLRAWQPFTGRGLLAIVLSAASLKMLYFPEQDLIAGVLGGSLLALCFILCLFSIILRIRLGRSLKAEVFFSSHDAYSKMPLDAGIVLENSSIFPYFTLEVQRIFEDQCERSGIESKTHLLKGREAPNSKRHLIDTIVFPHRGLWTMRGLKCTLKDALGLTALSWSLPNSSSIEISAQTFSIKPLPIVAASARAGDQLSLTRNRSGDLFDIRPYAPSDGIKRILWKTYARSGELVVRRPEPAIIPEGEVALYMIAEREDDFVAGAIQHYIAALERNQITILFGTDGLSGIDNVFHTQDSLESQVRHFTTAPEEIQRVINYSAWSPIAGTGRDFAKYLESLSLENRNVHQVIVFAPHKTEDPVFKQSQALVGKALSVISRNEAAVDTLWHMRIAKAASAHSAKLTLALVPPSLTGRTQSEGFAYPYKSRVFSKVGNAAKPIADNLLSSLRTAVGGEGAESRQPAFQLGSAEEIVLVERYE